LKTASRKTNPHRKSLKGSSKNSSNSFKNALKNASKTHRLKPVARLSASGGLARSPVEDKIRQHSNRYGLNRLNGLNRQPPIIENLKFSNILVDIFNGNDNRVECEV
jgi:hypothetical protein